jgi:GNAT superfamily N-acetyltransferase
VIRPLTDTDLPQVYAVINDAATAYRGLIPDDCYHQPYMPMEELRQEWAEITFYGWEADGLLVAVVGYQPLGEVTLLRHAYVLTSHQRRGIGENLLRHVLRLTRTRRLLVGTWADAWAVRFYQKHGFRLQPDGDRLLRAYWRIPDRQRETSVVLAMDLAG